MIWNKICHNINNYSRNKVKTDRISILILNRNFKWYIYYNILQKPELIYLRGMQLLKRSNCSSFCLEVYNLIIRDGKKRDPLTILGPGQPFPVYTPEVFHVVVSSAGEVFSNCSPLVAKLRLKLDDPLFFFRRELTTSFDSAFVYIISQ